MDPSLKQSGVRNELKRLWVTKLSLRCISSAACLIAIGFSAATFYIVIPLLAPCVAVLVWNTAEGITLIVRRRVYKGILPGVCVGVDLILWLALAVCAGLMAPVTTLPYYDYSSSDYYYSTFSTYLIIAVAMSILVTLLQISLFIIACVETHRRRKGTGQLAAAPFNPIQQPGPFNPYQPHTPFNPNQQQPGTFIPNQQPAFIPNPNPQQPGTFIPNPNPTTFPPNSPFPRNPQMAYYPPPGGYPNSQTQTQTQTPSPQSSASQPTLFGQGTLAPSHGSTTPSQPSRWPGQPPQQGQQHYEMSSSPAPHTAGVFNGAPPGRFNGGPPNMVAGYTAAPSGASPRLQHELSGGTPAAAGFTQTVPPQQQQQQQQQAQFGSQAGSQAGSPMPRYEMYVRTMGAEGSANPHEIGGMR